MTNPSRKTFIGLFALSAALMMPLAFAQTANTTPPSDTSAAPAAITPTTAATDKTAANTGNRKTWSELDADKDGNISKSEASADAGLSKIFAKADTNGDGVLTPDEYKTYVAINYQPRKGGQG